MQLGNALLQGMWTFDITQSLYGNDMLAINYTRVSTSSSSEGD